MEYALLTKISNFPPVSFSTESLASWILVSSVTSRLRVERPLSSRWDKTILSRAVAITCNPISHSGIVTGFCGWNWFTDLWSETRGLKHGLCLPEHICEG